MKRRHRIKGIYNINRFNRSLNQFSLARRIGKKEGNVSLIEGIQTISDIFSEKMTSINSYVEKFAYCEKLSNQYMNKMVTISHKLKTLKNSSKNLLYDKNRSNLVSDQGLLTNSKKTSKVELSIRKRSAVKKLLQTKIEKRSYAPSHSSLSSDEDFYSSKGWNE